MSWYHIGEFLPITEISIHLAESAKGEEFRQYADNLRLIIIVAPVEILTEVVIEDIEIDLFEFLADCIILI